MAAPRPILTALLALAAGLTAAALLAPAAREARAFQARLDAALGSSAERRERAWAAIAERADGDGLSRLDGLGPTLDARLLEASPEARRDAAHALHALDRWSWHARTPAVLSRFAAEALVADPWDPLARSTLRAAPLEAPTATVLPALAELLRRAHDREAAALALGWVGSARPETLESLAEQIAGSRHDALVALARTLRPSTRCAATLSDAGLGARPSADAALELDDIAPDAAIVVDGDGFVAEAVLAAELHLDASAARTLAEAWLRSLDDDRKRAGALLSALCGTHAELLTRALASAENGRVRTAFALALVALGEPPRGVVPEELVHRALAAHGSGTTAPPSSIDPDALLAGLLAGQRHLLLRATETPTSIADARRRGRVLARCVPAWHAELTEHAVSEPLEVAWRRLDVRSLLEWRRLEHDAAHRVWIPSPS